jgi:hypothetical protein
MKRKASAAVVLAALTWQAQALGEVKIAEQDGWRLSTDGRANAFVSVARGDGIPEGQPDYPGTATKDTKDSNDKIRSTRIRNGFLSSILAFNLEKQLFPQLKLTTRTALWMNSSGTRTKNTPGAIEPRELYGKLSGSWGSVLGGSDLALFGRGGILVDQEIAHDYGMGYPCMIESASGGACGMAGFGAIFPSFEPGFVYTTPSLYGFELAGGIYDPASVANAELNRAPWPRIEGEASFKFKKLFRVFGSAFWQKLEGSPPVNGELTDVETSASGWQGGGMVTLGPAMLGGAIFKGRAVGPISYIEENPITYDDKQKPHKTRGGFALGAFTVEPIHLKVAGGAGVFLMDKTENDPEPVNDVGLVGNPGLIKENFGWTVGVYQSTGPLHFALEYFQAKHTWHDYGEADLNDPTIVNIVTPKQVVNFVNAGFTIAW